MCETLHRSGAPEHHSYLIGIKKKNGRCGTTCEQANLHDEKWVGEKGEQLHYCSEKHEVGRTDLKSQLTKQMFTSTLQWYGCQM